MKLKLCPCVDIYACPLFLHRMELEERKDKALFRHPNAYDKLLLQWNRLFMNGVDAHGIDMLGFRGGEYVLTPPEETVDAEPVAVIDRRVSPFTPVPFTPPKTSTTFSVEPHIEASGRLHRGQNLPKDEKVARRAAKVRKEILKELAHWSRATR